MSLDHHHTDALVIIPTYNEKDNIGLLIPAILNNTTNFDILVVDDASPDNTKKTVQELQAIYPKKLHLLSRATKLGLGTAYIAGFKFALVNPYQYIFTMDADFSHDPQALNMLYSACKKEGYDMAIGSRYIRGGTVLNWPMRRFVLSYIANWLVRFITRLPIRDATAGFQCYRRTLLQTIGIDSIRSTGYGFQVEIKFLAWKYGFFLKEVPIVFNNRTRGYSKMSNWILLEGLYKIINLKITSFFKKFHRTERPL